MNGLLSQKATSPVPKCGDIKLFTWETRVSAKSGKEWIKLKNESEEYGGKPCEILSVERTDYTDAHGNISFNVEFTPVNGSGGVLPARQEAPVARPRQQTVSEPPNPTTGDKIAEYAAQSGKVFAAGWKQAEEWVKTLPEKDLGEMSLECYYDLWMRAAQHIAIDTGKTIRKERF